MRLPKGSRGRHLPALWELTWARAAARRSHGQAAAACSGRPWCCWRCRGSRCAREKMLARPPAAFPESLQVQEQPVSVAQDTGGS